MYIACTFAKLSGHNLPIRSDFIGDRHFNRLSAQKVLQAVPVLVLTLNPKHVSHNKGLD